MDCVRARGSVPGCERQQWGGDGHDKDDDDPVLSCRDDHFLDDYPDDHFLSDDRDDQEVVVVMIVVGGGGCDGDYDDCLPGDDRDGRLRVS